LTDRKSSLEQALEEAVSRALRDNLAPLQRTADELQHACADLVAACASSRPSNALPSLLRAQTAASALAAGLSVLSNFVAVALNPREQHAAQESAAPAAAVEDLDPPVATAEVDADAESVEEVVDEFATPSHESQDAAEIHSHAVTADDEIAAEAHLEQHRAVEVPDQIEVPEQIAEPPQAFDVAALSTELQEMHKRANRVAKVAMQDIKLLQPKEVKAGREHNDICVRLKVDIDKARKEYDRRFGAIQDHPVDYFHYWMVEILAGGDSNALGEYPYPSPALRR
jgi:hypothetical protein